MGRYGDPDALDALAWELAQRARSVRAAGEEHRRAGERARWASDAACVYRRRTAGDSAAVDAAADGMQQAADLLRRHADEVRVRLLEIARVERAVRAGSDSPATRGGELTEAVEDVLGGLSEGRGWPVPW